MRPDKIFYLVMLALGYQRYFRLFTAKLGQFEPTAILSFLSVSLENYLWVLWGSFICWTACTLIYFKNQNILLRALIGISVILVYSIANSFGKENHVFTFFAGVATLFSLMDLHKEFLSLQSCIRWSQIFLLSIYGSAGLWKIRSLIIGGDVRNLDASIRANIAYSIGEGNGPSPLLGQIEDWSWILLPGYVCTLTFQLLAFLPIFSKRLMSVWGIFAIIFHISNGLIMNIWFIEQAFGAFLFLILFNTEFSNFQINNSRKNSL